MSLCITTQEKHTVTFDDTGFVVSVYAWEYRPTHSTMSVTLDDQEVPLLPCLLPPLLEATGFPDSQPHPQFCCIDLIHWLWNRFEKERQSFIRRDWYDLTPLSDLSEPLESKSGDAFLLFGQVDPQSSRQPLHAFMYLGPEVYIWKPGAIGQICFTDFQTVLLPYQASHVHLLLCRLDLV